MGVCINPSQRELQNQSDCSLLYLSDVLSLQITYSEIPPAFSYNADLLDPLRNEV